MTSNIVASPWAYFLAGALLPTIAGYFLLGNRLRDSDDDDDDSDDEDLFGIVATGPSSSWSILHAPYKVRACTVW